MHQASAIGVSSCYSAFNLFRSFSFLEVIATFQFSFSRDKVIERPIPLVDPVITAFIFINISIFSWVLMDEHWDEWFSSGFADKNYFYPLLAKY